METIGFYDFIERYALNDADSLRLKYASRKNDLGFPLDFALVQIESRRKSRKKIPSFLSNKEFLFPSTLASEQASNEAVARYHASLIKPGSSLLDLTAGLGIDDMTFAKKGISVTACEIKDLNCDVLRHNARILDIEDKIDVKCGDSIEFLANEACFYDTVFADPARRGDAGKRLHALSDCMPDILGNMSLILKHTDRLLVKSSPLLDLALIRNTVKDLRLIHVVCFRGECKEVLIEIEKNKDFEGIITVDLDWDDVISEFFVSSADFRDVKEIPYSSNESPSSYKYLYEPNAGIMKTGAWSGLIALFPDLTKTDPNTHLFLSDTYYARFPGRIVEIDSLVTKRDAKALKGSKINIVARNYPLTSAQIEKKYGMTAGGGRFLYAFRYNGNPVMLTSHIRGNDSRES